ncbi:16348_t:CDS:2, partial [Racocetra persica]
QSEVTTKMRSLDTTIPVYREAVIDDIEDFLLTIKDMQRPRNMIRKQSVLGYICICWNVKRENKLEMKITVKTLKQDEKESVKELNEPYHSKIEDCYLKNYDKTKKKAVEMEEYNRDKSYNKQNDPTSPDTTSNINKSDVDIDSLVTKLAALKINCVNQEDQSKHDQVENLIQNIVTKTIKDMNKRPSQPCTTKPQMCYLCQEVGHIVKECPKQNKGTEQSKNALKFDNVDIRMVEFTEIRPKITSKYLKAELLDDGVGYDIRPVVKRKREDTTIESVEYLNKK